MSKLTIHLSLKAAVAECLATALFVYIGCGEYHTRIYEQANSLGGAGC